ncbi:MAG: hypothetical protein IKG30_09965 [Clostridiales bacterium]|nr:hypothetical protein [Clostridiales bacterium]
MFEALGKYLSIVLDYSIVLEYSNGVWFDELTYLFEDKGIDCYIDDTFKLLHRCVVQQQDPKDVHVQNAMRSLMQSLMSTNTLHVVHTCNTEYFIEQVKDLPECCILTTRKGIFTKRLYERAPEFNGDVAVLSNTGLKIFHSIAEMIEDYPLPSLSSLASNNTYIDSDGRASIDDVVISTEGDKFTLVKRLSGGAEGMVFFTDNPKYVAKIYHKGVITPLRWAKLKKLTSLGITSRGFCTPQHLLYFRGVPVGYTMFMGKGTTLSNVFDGPDAIIDQYPDWTRLDVCETLLSLIGKYLYLQMHDIVAGDIQLKNALINSSTEQYLIDMDSVQIGNLPCPVGTEDFTDPRLWGRDFSSFVRTLEDEDYSIAMLVFTVLFCGLHPYATRNGAETLREEILDRNFPYTLDNSNTEHIPLGGYEHIWEYLPDNLRVMLYNTFHDGKIYEAVCWRAAVQEYMKELENFVYDDAEAYKLFPCENINQATVNVAEVREQLKAKMEAKNTMDERRGEAKTFEKKTFANAPTGRFVSSSVGTSDNFRPEKTDNEQSPWKSSSSSKPASIAAVNSAPPPPPRKKFFGLF